MREGKSIAGVKQRIRAILNVARMRDEIDGHQALAVLLSLGAEFVAKVQCDSVREEFVRTVQVAFPEFVELERLSDEGMKRQ